jgi:hypothetical protein
MRGGAHGPTPPTASHVGRLEAHGWRVVNHAGRITTLARDNDDEPESHSARARSLREALSKHFGVHKRDFVYDVDSQVAALADGPDFADASCCWNLQRIVQRSLPLNGLYRYPDSDGLGVDIYVVDTGVQPHQQFGSRLVQEYTVFPGNYTDCNGRSRFSSFSLYRRAQDTELTAPASRRATRTAWRATQPCARCGFWIATAAARSAAWPWAWTASSSTRSSRTAGPASSASRWPPTATTTC